MTLEEFKSVPYHLVIALTCRDHAISMSRNQEYGLQLETVTPRDGHEGPYMKERTYYYMDGDERQFNSIEELYEAFCMKYTQE